MLVPRKHEAVVLGGYWDDMYKSGSPVSLWFFSSLSDSFCNISARAVCDHLNFKSLSESEDKKIKIKTIYNQL